MQSTINQISEQILLAVKTQKSTKELQEELKKLPFDSLIKELSNNTKKKAFWINIYNAFFQILRLEKNLVKPRIYTDKEICIAGKDFSLDDIEHGILRRYRYKFSLGYLPNIFTNNLIKKLAVNKVDYRIHFALNCGAKSCPPIAFYSLDRLEEQLNTAAISFLEGETDIFEDKKEVHITRLFQWFLGDFGGKSGVRNVLKEHLDLNTKGFKLVYKEYSWEEDLGNFSF